MRQCEIRIIETVMDGRANLMDAKIAIEKNINYSKRALTYIEEAMKNNRFASRRMESINNEAA